MGRFISAGPQPLGGISGSGFITLGPATLSATGTVSSLIPAMSINAFLTFSRETDEGQVIASVGVAWRKIFALIAADPQSIYQFDGFKWEEILAGAYEESRLFDEVILTPRSSDRGRDIIATKRGRFSLRIIDQMRAYAPPRVVTAEQVRAMIGVVLMQRDVTKGLITTTADFAPRLLEDPDIRAHVPYRLELRSRDRLLEWLAGLPDDGTSPRLASASSTR